MSLDREDWDYMAILERLPESDHSEYGARDSWMIFGKRNGALLLMKPSVCKAAVTTAL